MVNIKINNDAAYGYDVRGELVGEKGATSITAVLCDGRFRPAACHSL